MKRIANDKKTDEFRFMALSLNMIEFRFWVEFLIRQFILEVTFPFDWGLCCEYRQPIAQVGGTYIYSPRLDLSNWPNIITQSPWMNWSHIILFVSGRCKAVLIWGVRQIGCDKTFVQYIPRNIHTVFALLWFVVIIHWLVFPYPSGLLHWHCGNLTIAPVPAKQPWWIWINTSCEFIMNDCITPTKQSTTKPCVYFLRYTVSSLLAMLAMIYT